MNTALIFLNQSNTATLPPPSQGEESSQTLHGEGRLTSLQQIRQRHKLGDPEKLGQ